MPDNEVDLGAMDLDRHLADPALKRAFVTPMFDLIAPRYDAFTRVFSFGMDRRWKERLLSDAAAALPAGAQVADLATGTGDLAVGLARRRADVRVSAVDNSSRMLTLAQGRVRGGRLDRISVMAGDLASLPFPGASQDGVIAGYAFRNAPDWRHAVEEVARVLRPGGHLYTLDFYRPGWVAWRAPFLWWLWTAGRLVGWRWHGQPMAYGYIARSIEHFTSWRGFSGALEASGLAVTGTRRYLGGGIAIHHAVKR